MDETNSIHISMSDAVALTELEAEFEREMKRNEAALILVREREREANAAKSRAQTSQKIMQGMKTKYTLMQHKLESTRKTLNDAQNRIDRQNQIRATMKNLQDRADLYAEKLRMQKQSGSPPNLGFDESAFDFPEPLINYDEEDSSADSTSSDQHQQPETKKAASITTIDFARTVFDLQEKLSRVSAQASPEQPPAQPNLEQSQAADVVLPILSAIMEEIPQKCDAVPNPEKLGEVEEEQEVDEEDDELTMNLNESVQRLEAKCAGVREELGRMALSEQYMRTKQAQLRAKREEMKATQALTLAEAKEKEAEEMRSKVEGMMRLLRERRNKLNVTENVLEKKTVVVEKVNKIVDRKERTANYMEKQRNESLAFGKKPK